MCFSATASFTAGAGLFAIGSYCVSRVAKKRFLPLALIPLFFAIQQFSEGFIWIFAEQSEAVFKVDAAKNIYLFFAYIFWPIWIPFSFWICEKDIKRKRLIIFCLGMGVCLGALLGLQILEMEVKPHRFGLQYLKKGDWLKLHVAYVEVGIFLYGICVLLPLFFSSIKNTAFFGGLLALGLFLTLLLWLDLFVSLWCFFSAIISAGLLFILKPYFKKGS